MLSATGGRSVPTALDVIGHDRRLQEHFLARTAAYLIDVVITVFPFWVVSLLLTGKPGVVVPSLAAGLVMIFYSAYFEATGGATVGKILMRLRVVSTKTPLDFRKTFIRNLSKLSPLFVLVDLIWGMATPGDPRQRGLDRIAETVVVDERTLRPFPSDAAPTP